MATGRHEVFRIAIIATLVLALALTLSAPDRLGFWMACVVAVVGLGPYFGKGRRAYVWMRLLAVSIGAPLLFAFGVSSPERAAFWVVVVATALILLPTIAVSIHFLTDKR